MPNITDAASQRIRVGRRRHPKIRVIGHMKVPSSSPLWSFARKRLSDQEMTISARKLSRRRNRPRPHFRAFAAVGHSDQREDRLWMAEYLERKADELEQLAAKDHN